MMVVDDIKNQLNLKNVHVVKSRAEDLNDVKFDYMLGRSVSAVPTFLGFASHLIDDKSNAAKSGLLYIKGGEFKDELEEADIIQYDILAIRDLTQLETDKNLLHIPSVEVCNFHRRKIELVEKSEIKKNKKKPKYKTNKHT